MSQLTLDRFVDNSCPHRFISDHNGYAYCHEPAHFTKWGYDCYCPPIGCGDPPSCQEIVESNPNGRE